MDIVILATSLYDDRFAADWQPDLRYTACFLRRNQVEAGFVYEPTLTNSCVLERCAALAPRILFLDLTEENREPVLSFIALFKRAHPEVLTAVGGIPATLLAADFLRDHQDIDFIIAGERDATLLDAIGRLRKGESLDGVAGLQSRRHRNPPRPLIRDLDCLGYMIHDGLADLLEPIPPAERVGYLASSRGCYANCSFCGVPSLFRYSGGSAWRGRSPGAVVSELCAISKKFEIRRFVFQDENFIGPGEAGQVRARNIAEEILRRRLRIEYFFCCRLNDVRRDTFERLRESGLEGVGISVESMNQQSLNLLGKGLKAAAVYPALDLIEAIGIRCEVNLIFFDPYATLDGVRNNLALLEYLRKSERLLYSDAFPFNELTAFPWSRVASRLRSEGLLADEDDRCRFRDPKVARLAEFVRRLRIHLPCCFKKQFLFDVAESAHVRAGSPQAIAVVSRLCAGVRHWVGLDVLPRAVYAACEALEHGPKESELRLRELEASFKNELGVLHTLERCLSDMVSADST